MEDGVLMTWSQVRVPDVLVIENSGGWSIGNVVLGVSVADNVGARK
jgi:hypothetical protein